MANNIIQIKRSSTNATPASLNVGELAYSFISNTLFIGNLTSNAVAVGGQYYMNLISATAGTLTAGKAIIVDTNSLINQLNVGNTTVNAVISTSGVKLSNSTVNTSLTLPNTTQYAATNYFLHANGTWVAVTAGGGTPGGSNTQVQFNDSGSFGGNTSLTFDKSTQILGVGNGTATTNTVITAGQIVLSNTSSNITITIPANTQVSNGTFFLNANGSYSVAFGNPGRARDEIDWTIPTTSTFTTFRSGSTSNGTITNLSNGRGVRLSAPRSNSNLNSLTYAVVAVSLGASNGFFVQARLRRTMPLINYIGTGIIMRNSSSSKSICFNFNNNTNVGLQLDQFSGDDQFASGVALTTYPFIPEHWLRVYCDGTNFKYYWSTDGDFWEYVGGTTIAASYLTTQPTHVGISINPNSGTGVYSGNAAALDCLSFTTGGV